MNRRKYPTAKDHSEKQRMRQQIQGLENTLRCEREVLAQTRQRLHYEEKTSKDLRDRMSSRRFSGHTETICMAFDIDRREHAPNEEYAACEMSERLHNLGFGIGTEFYKAGMAGLRAAMQNGNLEESMRQEKMKWMRDNTRSQVPFHEMSELWDTAFAAMKRLLTKQ